MFVLNNVTTIIHVINQIFRWNLNNVTIINTGIVIGKFEILFVILSVKLYV